MIDFARALPKLRKRVAQRPRPRRACRASRVLACAVRLLDRGFFRIGSEDYAEENDTYGIATMQKRHVTVDGDEISFDYEAKGGQRRRAGDRRPGGGRDRRERSSAAAAGATSCSPTRTAGAGSTSSRPDINEYVKRGRRRRLQRQGLPHLERHGARRRRRSRSRRTAASLEDRAQARQDARHQGGRALPRQHPGRLPRLLHRPARVRPLRRRAHDRRRAARARRGHGSPGRRFSGRSRRPCSTCSPSDTESAAVEKWPSSRGSRVRLIVATVAGNAVWPAFPGRRARGPALAAPEQSVGRRRRRSRIRRARTRHEDRPAAISRVRRSRGVGGPTSDRSPRRCRSRGRTG